MRNIGVFNNTLASNQEKARELKKFVGKRKNLSVSAPSVPTEHFSTSVLAEQLSAIEGVGVKRLHVVVYMLLMPSLRGSYATATIQGKSRSQLRVQSTVFPAQLLPPERKCVAHSYSSIERLR